MLLWHQQAVVRRRTKNMGRIPPHRSFKRSPGPRVSGILRVARQACTGLQEEAVRREMGKQGGSSPVCKTAVSSAPFMRSKFCFEVSDETRARRESNGS